MLTSPSAKAIEITGAEAPAVAVHFSVAGNGEISCDLQFCESRWSSAMLDGKHACTKLLPATKETFGISVPPEDMRLSQVQLHFLNYLFIN